MTRGKHALKPDRKAQAKKAGVVLTALAASGAMVTEATGMMAAVHRADGQAIQSQAHSEGSRAQASSSSSSPDGSGQERRSAAEGTEKRSDAGSTAAADTTATASAQAPLPSAVSTPAQNATFNQPVAQTGHFIENPAAALPPRIADSLPGDAEMVGSRYAQTPDGTIYDAETGRRTTDPRIVGTVEEPADPLAKSDGLHFVPVPIATARQEVARYQASLSENPQGSRVSQGSAGQSEHTATASAAWIGARNRNARGTDAAGDDAARDGVVRGRLTRTVLDGQSLADHPAASRIRTRSVSDFSGYYGAHWGSNSHGQAFFNRHGQAIVQQASKGVDVSEWQSNVDWAKAKRSGVQVAIIRTNYGHRYKDKKVDRNIAECRRLGIPFGIYMYSIARSASEARQEADFTSRILRSNHVSQSTLSLPVYLDLENFTGHPGTGTYVQIVDAWMAQMRANGFTNLSVYSYTSYLDSTLDSPSIHSKVGWAAQYAGGLQYTNFSGNFRGWQYSDHGRIDGFPTGSVDLDAIGYGTPVSSPSTPSTPSTPSQPARAPYITSRRILRIANGEYYISSALSPAVSLEIPGASPSDGTIVRTYAGNGTRAQRFRFTRNTDGTYTIVNVHSGKALDVPSAIANNGKAVQQYTPNGTRAQRWYVREGRGGAVFLQSALGDYVLDLTGRRTSNGTVVQLWNSDDNRNQQFVLASATAADRIPTNTPTEIRSDRDRGQVFDIPGANRNNGAAVSLHSANGTNAQRFLFRPVGNGAYRIINVNSGKAIDVPGDATGNSTRLQQYTDNGTEAQQWYVRDGGNGTVSFFSRASGRFMDLPGGSTADGTRVQIYDGNGSAAQKFVLVRASARMSAAQRLLSSHRSDLPNGTYRFAASQDTGFALEVAGATRADGGNVQIYRQNATNAQLWNVSHDELGFVTITNVATGKILDLVGAAARQGQNIDQYTSNGTAAQRWIAVRSRGGIVLHSAVDPDFVLDIAANSMRSGTNVRAWRQNGTDGQRFIAQPPLTGTALSDVLASVHRADLADGAYRFGVGADPGFVLDLSGASSANGANVQIYRSNGSAAQLWEVTHDAKGYVQLRNAASGKMLDLSGAVARDGQNVGQYQSNGTRAQKWIAERSGHSVVLRSAVNPGFVLDIAANSMRSGTNVRIWHEKGTAAQRWIA